MNNVSLTEAIKVLIAKLSSDSHELSDEEIRLIVLLKDSLEQTRANDPHAYAWYESEKSFRSFYEGSPLSYQSLDTDGCYLDVNPVWVETFGYSREEIIGSKFSDLMTTDSQRSVSKHFPTLKDQGAVRDVPFDIIHKSGNILHISLHGKSSYDEQGVFQCTNCVLVDVTPARQAEKQLRQSEELNRLLSHQFQTLLDGIPDRIMLLDSDLRIVWSNQKADLHQITFTQEPKGCLCFEILRGRTTVCPECPAVQCFLTGDVVNKETVSPNGQILEQRCFPIFDDQGNVCNVVDIAQDITEGRTLQKDTVRTGQLAALGELAAGVAHEINNPINGVINYAQLLKNSSEEGSKSKDLAERIIREGDRIARIVSQLLFLARDSGNAMEVLDLTEILSDSLSLVGSQFNGEGIDIEVSVAENLPKMHGQAQHLEQLFLNILSNARYALNQRYPETNPNKRLEVWLDCVTEESKPCLKVRFHDHGIGIPAEFISKIMLPFVTSKPSADGTGLGLSISNDIVKKHGGALTVDSKEGFYTEVSIRFPVDNGP